MSRLWAFSLVIVAVGFPVAGDKGNRIRLENTSQPGSRVKITFADPEIVPVRLEAGDDGSSELVVEAPSPRLRLRGGSLRTDPMIAALARRQLRDASPAPSLLVIDHSEPPAPSRSFDGPLVYDDWGGSYWGSGYWGGSSWGGGCCDGGGRGRLRDIPVAREIPRRDSEARPVPPPRSGGSYSARGVIPRVGGRR